VALIDLVEFDRVEIVQLRLQERCSSLKNIKLIFGPALPLDIIVFI
jgi:hypothetical protein